jgi:hypothetical protein
MISHKSEFVKASLYNGGTANINNYKSQPRREVYMYYLEKTVRLKSKTKLVTFNGFVSSFGGSLGLFLGFSCLSTLFDLVDYIKKKLEK